MINIKCFEFNFLPVNTYVIWDDTLECAIIDPGCYYKKEYDELADFIKDNQLKVKQLLNTHLHFDHILGNTFVEETYGVKARGNDLDNPWIIYMAERMAEIGIRYEGHINPIEPANVLHEGDKVTFGKTVLDVLQIPGHSPGSVVFLCKENRSVFTGDVLFNCGIGRSDFHDSDGKALIEGIVSKLLTLPNDTVVYPGHGPATTIGNERHYFM